MAANMTDNLSNDDMDIMLSQVAENISFFILKFWCGTHMTQLFLKKFLDSKKILEENEQFFSLFFKVNGKSETDCWRTWPRSVFSSATDVNHTFASVWLVMIQNIYNTFNFLYGQIYWSRARPRSIYQHILEIKSTLNIAQKVLHWVI
jgi:hypothetical protein